MLHYDEIVNYRNDTISDYKSVFIFSPKKNQYEKVKDALMFSGLNSPAFLDEKGMFPAVNPHIPADDRFYTFLLDKNGKVVLVGNPVNNPQLWELYKTTITTLIENGGTMPDVEK